MFGGPASDGCHLPQRGHASVCDVLQALRAMRDHERGELRSLISQKRKEVSGKGGVDAHTGGFPSRDDAASLSPGETAPRGGWAASVHLSPPPQPKSTSVWASILSGRVPWRSADTPGDAAGSEKPAQSPGSAGQATRRWGSTAKDRKAPGSDRTRIPTVKKSRCVGAIEPRYVFGPPKAWSTAIPVVSRASGDEAARGWCVPGYSCSPARGSEP